jgi:hypothetical protein
MLEFRDARCLIAEGERKLLRAEEKKTAAEGYLFRAQVFTHICHLIFDPSTPPSPKPSANTAYPSINASEGPSDEWGYPTWIDPPSQPLCSPLTWLGPCETCGDVYDIQASCPFEFCCHSCWGTNHLTTHCPVCPADEEMYEEELLTRTGVSHRVVHSWNCAISATQDWTHQDNQLDKIIL